MGDGVGEVDAVRPFVEELQGVLPLDVDPTCVRALGREIIDVVAQRLRGLRQSVSHAFKFDVVGDEMGHLLGGL